MKTFLIVLTTVIPTYQSFLFILFGGSVNYVKELTRVFGKGEIDNSNFKLTYNITIFFNVVLVSLASMILVTSGHDIQVKPLILITSLRLFMLVIELFSYMDFYEKYGAENYKQKAWVSLVDIMLAFSMVTYVIYLVI